MAKIECIIFRYIFAANRSLTKVELLARRKITVSLGNVSMLTHAIHWLRTTNRFACFIGTLSKWAQLLSSGNSFSGIWCLSFWQQLLSLDDCNMQLRSYITQDIVTMEINFACFPMWLQITIHQNWLSIFACKFPQYVIHNDKGTELPKSNLHFSNTIRYRYFIPFCCVTDLLIGQYLADMILY